MKGFLIVIFAVCMFAFAKLCCDEKRPNADDASPLTENATVLHHS
jgi:hypothetical protein